MMKKCCWQAAVLITACCTVQGFVSNSHFHRTATGKDHVHVAHISAGDTTASSRKPTTKANGSYDGSPTFVWSRQWYPVLPLAYIAGIENKPLSFQLLGKNLVLWKVGNKNPSFAVMEDECPHRRAPLSTGKVVDGCKIMCRFHGWEFSSDGKCEKIPMFNEESSKLGRLLEKEAFQAKSYPTKVAGGLLWVYIGEDSSTPPGLREDILIPDALLGHVEWIANILPVSYMSLVENSFDPSHAPFIHEGSIDFSGRPYAPDGATAMQFYKVIGNMTESGFLMEHTPYEKRDDPSATVRRQFVPPVTQKTTYAKFNVNLYFVPWSPRETMVITTVPSFRRKMDRFFPASVQEFLQDMRHFKHIAGQSMTRFNLQDIITMQGQDSRKLQLTDLDLNKVVTDLAPTPADAGFNAFQRWIRKFARAGPFSDPRAVFSVESLAKPAPKSLWNTHGKYCPRCKRVMARAEYVQQRASQFSTIAITASCLLGIVRSMLGQSLIAPLVMLVVALILNWIQNKAKHIQDRMYKAKEVEIADVYAY